MRYPVQIVTLFAILGVAGEAPARDRVEAGKCVTEKGSVLSRTKPSEPWSLTDKDGAVYTGDTILGLTESQVASRNGAVTLTFLTDLDEKSPYPIVESAVELKTADKVDLAFELERGRVNVVNSKKEGPAIVQFWVRDSSWEVVLGKPGAKVGIETFGRWARGVRFLKEPTKDHAPHATMILIVLVGDVVVKHEGKEVGMSAPPGPATITWDSVTGTDSAPQHLDKLPDWANPDQSNSELAQRKRAVMDMLRKKLVESPSGEVLEAMAGSDNESVRRLAVVGLAATDDLARLGNVLRNAKHQDLWENGVRALRHWIGRAPGQDQILYKGLVEVRGIEPSEAETILQLLHSFDEADLAKPKLYETLIHFLEHDEMAVRGLAYWHLERLVPQGKEFGFTPMASKEVRDKAVEQWRKLIPAGELPPKSK